MSKALVISQPFTLISHTDRQFAQMLNANVYCQFLASTSPDLNSPYFKFYRNPQVY